MKTVCSRCGKLLWEAPEADRERDTHLCADCGGQPPVRHVEAKDSAKLHERAKLQERDNPRSAPFREVVVRDELTRNTGRWSDRKIDTDKPNDVYEETVTDQESGTVIYHKRERLSDHKGHGADKRPTQRDAA